MLVLNNAMIITEMLQMGKDDNINAFRCSYTCTVEKGFKCPHGGQPCESICGDGYYVKGESCEDGNYHSNDGCNSTCTSVESGWKCSGGSLTKKQTCSPICGDSLKKGTEACDDGNYVAGDG